MARKAGIDAELDGLDAGSVPETDAAEQMELLPSPLGRAVEAQRPEAERGRGRPKGARNRRTTDLVKFMAARGYRSPAEVLAETYSMPVEALAKELHCGKADAFKLQLDAAKALAPYLHQRQPIAVDLEAKGDLSLSINLGAMFAEKSEDESEGFSLLIDGESTESKSEENQ